MSTATRKSYTQQLQDVNDVFALRRRLDDETRDRLRVLQCTRVPDELVYVMEWYDDTDGMLTGVGPLNDRGNNRTVRMPLRVQPGLFVASARVDILRKVCRAYGYTHVEAYERLTFISNSFALQDMLYDPRLGESRVILVKIVTATFRDSTALYWRFKRDQHAYRYACVTQYWDATRQVFFELFLRENMHNSPTHLSSVDERSHAYRLPRLSHR